MPAARSSLIAATSNPLLERTLWDKLQRRTEATGHLGEIEPLAVRLGLMQKSLRPRLHEPQLLVFAADHGLAIEGPAPAWSTAERVRRLLEGRLALTVFARLQGMGLTVVDAGVSELLPAHEGLLRRKIAHGTRNSRVGAAMTVEQAHSAIKAGMEIGSSLAGNAVACAGLGVGSHDSAAMLLSRLTDAPLAELLLDDPQSGAADAARALALAQAACARHRETRDPIESLAAVGGFEVAMMVGLMLVAAGRRHVVLVDGMAACAALMVASRIAPAVTDYCVFCRSHDHRGLDQAMSLFRATALLELGMDSTDGSGATFAWPLLAAAAGLLAEPGEGEDAEPASSAGADSELDLLLAPDAG